MNLLNINFKFSIQFIKDKNIEFQITFRLQCNDKLNYIFILSKSKLFTRLYNINQI